MDLTVFITYEASHPSTVIPFTVLDLSWAFAINKAINQASHFNMKNRDDDRALYFPSLADIRSSKAKLLNKEQRRGGMDVERQVVGA